MKAFTKVKEVVDKVLNLFCIALMGIMTVLVVYQVAARFVGHPSAITERTSQYLFVFSVMFGTALMFGENGHLEITTIKDKLGAKPYNIVVILANLTLIAFSALVLVYGGAAYAINQWGVVDAALQISMGLIMTSVPICGILMVFYGIYNTAVAIQEYKANRRPGVEVSNGTL